MCDTYQDISDSREHEFTTWFVTVSTILVIIWHQLNHQECNEQNQNMKNVECNKIVFGCMESNPNSVNLKSTLII